MSFQKPDSTAGPVSPSDETCIFLNRSAIQLRFMFMRTTLVFLLAVPLWAQDPLSLREAVRLAIRENKAIAGTAAGAQASEARITQARGGRLPKINYSESFTRSDNPVFVFSSLLTQHQFGVENFAIGPLNRPDPLNNFQSQVTVDQPIYDAGQTRNAVKSAELAQKMTGEEQRLVQMNVISGAARAYYGAVLAAENLKAAEQAVRSAEADLKRAEAVRTAGMSTDVDASVPFYFSQQLDHEASATWQVLRSEFDQLLLDNAREKGAEVIEEITARELIRSEE